MPSSASVTINLKLTVTWVPDPHLQSDPAPPSVWITENAKTEYSGGAGSASDGLGDPFTQTSPTSGYCATPTTSSKPPPDWTKKSGSSFTINRTLTASATYSGQYGGNLSCYIDSYSIGIHAQPYNWHQTLAYAGDNGVLSFMYQWNSTSGSVSDLTSCYVHEWVTYPGPNPYIPPPS